MARGEENREHQGPTKTWSTESKIELVRRLLGGESLDALSRETGASEAQLSEWRDVFIAAGTAELGGRASDRRARGHRVWLGVIFGVALAARTLWVVYAPADPTDGRECDDSCFYHNSASMLAEGTGYRTYLGLTTALWPPGYTFFLGALYWIFGARVTIGWIANIVLGALTCGAVYLLGDLMRGRKTGVIAGLLLAVFPGHVFFSSLLLSETPFTLLVVVAMILILTIGRDAENASRRRIILLGVVVGAATLVRGQGLLLPFVALAFWWLHNANWKRTLKSAALVGATCLAFIAPWTIRNYVTMNSFVLLSTNMGYNFYIGHHDRANGGYLWGTTGWIEHMFDNLPAREREVAAGRAAFHEGLKFMLTHPRKEAELAVSKLHRLYRHDLAALEMIDCPKVGKGLKSVALLADIANGYYFAVLAASLLGLLCWVRRPRSAVALPLVMVALYTLGQLLFFTIPRFHHPLLPSFCLLAAVGVALAAQGVAWAARHVRSR